MRRWLPLALTLAVALPSFAWRREYTLLWDGQRKAGGEVCFYRGTRGDAFTLFLTASRAECLPADAVLDFPPGLIHVFARHKDGYASLSRDYVVDDGPPAPERGYQRLDIPLVKAGRVDFGSIGAQQRAGLWIASTPTSLGTFIPLLSGETSIVAPAEVMLVPLLVENGLPVAVGEPLYLAPGERQTAMFAKHEGTTDVIVWTHADAPSLAEARSTLPAPVITLRVGEQTLRPVAPLYNAESNTFLIFRHVPPGRATVTLNGTMWKRVERAIAVGAQPVTIDRDALPLIAGGSIEVHWAEAEQPECGKPKPADVPPVRATLVRCATCEPVAKAAGASSIAFDGVAPGAWTLLVQPPYGKAQAVKAEVVGGRRTTVDVTFPAFHFFGRLTVNGKPLHARLAFLSGTAVTDDDGRYNAALPSEPRQDEVEIAPCDGSRLLHFIATKQPAANAPYDIELQIHALGVTVLDPQGKPVEGAAVRFSPVKTMLPQGSEVYYGSDSRTTDREGLAAFDDVPAGSSFSVCAHHPQFVTKCAGPFDKAEATVQFDPAGMRGRVEGHSGEGMIAVVTPARTVAEEANLESDGHFVLRQPHAAPEYLVYISRTRPLTVIPLPLVAPPELALALPAARVRSFTVSAPDLQVHDGYVGLWVGGRYVPLQTLNTHQEWRGLDCVVHPNEPVTIRDIAETGPIAVALGTLPPDDGKDFVDVFTLPQCSGVDPQRVDAASLTLPVRGRSAGSR
jgi:hypothetical protein